MRLFLVVLLAISGCSRPGPPPPAGTTFTKATPAPGETRRTTTELVLDAKLGDGTPVTAHERGSNTTEAASDPVTAALPDGPLAPGARIDALARAIAARMVGMEVTRATVTFEGAQGDDGTFDVALAMRKTEGPFAMTMDLAGKLHVSTKTGAATSMHVEGPVTLKGAEITGAGTVTIDLAEK